MKPKPRRAPYNEQTALLGTTETKIKDIILNGYIENKTEQELLQLVVTEINNYLDIIPSGDRLAYRQSLNALSRKIFLQARKLNKLKPIPPYVDTKYDVRKDVIQVRDTTVFITDYQQRVKEITKAISNIEPVIQEGRKKVSARLKAELSVRNEAIQKNLEELRQRGVNIIVVSTHANCSARCEKWQGGIYSLDGSTGKTDDGKPYIPLDTAIKGDKGDGNGLFGYNCRHRAYEYKSGMKPPVEFTEREIKQSRKVDEAMREYERKMRKLWQIYKVSPDLGQRKSARVKWGELFEEYFKLCEKNNRAIEEWRCK
jgi:hypothetical protein